MSDVDYKPCDCRGPNSRVDGECAVLAEFRVIRDVQARLARGEINLEQARAELLAPYQAQYAARLESRERSADPRDLEFRLQRLGVPPRVLVALRGPQETAAIIEARKFAGAPPEMVPFLTLLGAPGLGKTVAAAWVFREVARHTSPDRPTGMPEPLVWAQAADFTRVSAFSQDDEARLRAMRSAVLLVVDDAGDEATALGAAALGDVLKARESAGRRSVITSNLRPDAFRTRYGQALWDRLAGRGLLPRLEGNSMRRRAVP